MRVGEGRSMPLGWKFSQKLDRAGSCKVKIRSQDLTEDIYSCARSKKIPGKRRKEVDDQPKNMLSRIKRRDWNTALRNRDEKKKRLEKEKK